MGHRGHRGGQEVTEAGAAYTARAANDPFSVISVFPSVISVTNDCLVCEPAAVLHMAS